MWAPDVRLKVLHAFCEMRYTKWIRLMAAYLQPIFHLFHSSWLLSSFTEELMWQQLQCWLWIYQLMLLVLIVCIAIVELQPTLSVTF